MRAKSLLHSDKRKAADWEDELQQSAVAYPKEGQRRSRRQRLAEWQFSSQLPQEQHANDYIRNYGHF